MSDATVPPLEAMTDSDILDHLRQMHGYRMPCCVTTDEHDRDHQRTDRNVAADVEPHHHQAVLTWSTGGYPHDYHPSTAGPWGCDPCWDCGRRPAKGETVWSNGYGDLYCDPCARRRATSSQGAASTST